MFGYVKPRYSDLLVKEYDFFRSAYCGVCQAMRRETGFLSSLSLSYDMVFLAVCRMLVTDRAFTAKRCRCTAHPCRGRQCLLGNEAFSYAARASAVLLYEKCLDDKADGSHPLLTRLALPIFRRAARRASLSFLMQETGKCLSELSKVEAANTPSVDAPAAIFGDLLGLVFADGLDEENYPLFYNVGYHLGVFIYAADAADDYKSDKKRGSYNPYVLLYPDGEGFDGGIPDHVKVSLQLTLQSLGDAVEKLPFRGDPTLTNIIKNTVYFGLPDRIAQLGISKAKKNKEASLHRRNL